MVMQLTIITNICIDFLSIQTNLKIYQYEKAPGRAVGT